MKTKLARIEIVDICQNTVISCLHPWDTDLDAFKINSDFFFFSIQVSRADLFCSDKWLVWEICSLYWWYSDALLLFLWLGSLFLEQRNQIRPVRRTANKSTWLTARFLLVAALGFPRSQYDAWETAGNAISGVLGGVADPFLLIHLDHPQRSDKHGSVSTTYPARLK